MKLIYQAYGKTEILEQTLFSVVSLLKMSETVRPVVYTDRPSYFEEFMSGREGLTVIPITMEDIKRWRGAIDFVHRVKIEILADSAKKFGENIYYADGDTYFLKDPAEIFQQVDETTSLMHLPEAELGKPLDPLTKKIFKFVKKNAFQLSGHPIKMDGSTIMWNAGVIGLARAKASLLQDILNLTDQMYALYPKHVMEQLAVSFILQKNGTIKRTDDVIYHYWNQKEEYQKMICEFLNTNSTIADALREYENLAFPPAPKIQTHPNGWFKSLFSKS